MSTIDQDQVPKKPHGFQKWFGRTIALLLLLAALAIGATYAASPKSDQPQPASDSSDGIILSN